MIFRNPRKWTPTFLLAELVPCDIWSSTLIRHFLLLAISAQSLHCRHRRFQSIVLDLLLSISVFPDWVWRLLLIFSCLSLELIDQWEWYWPSLTVEVPNLWRSGFNWQMMQKSIYPIQWKRIWWELGKYWHFTFTFFARIHLKRQFWKIKNQAQSALIQKCTLTRPSTLYCAIS